jgi:arylsulfatase
VLYPGAAALPDEVSPNTIDRSHVIRAEFARESTAEGGVLVSRGDAFGGFALYVHENRHCYEENVAGESNELTSAPDLPLACTVEFRFTRTGRLAGRGVLAVDGTDVASGSFDATIPDLIATSGGLRCGTDGPLAVGTRYEGRNPFRGALARVTIELGDPGAPDSGDAMEAELRRQ